MEQLINRLYEAVKKRGCITSETNHHDFVNKLCEEMDEIQLELMFKTYLEKNESLKEEITDTMAVCISFLKWLGSDPIKELEKVVIKNERRANEVIFN